MCNKPLTNLCRQYISDENCAEMMAKVKTPNFIEHYSTVGYQNNSKHCCTNKNCIYNVKHFNIIMIL